MSGLQGRKKKAGGILKALWTPAATMHVAEGAGTVDLLVQTGQAEVR